MNIGFIGAGNMAGSIIEGIINAGFQRDKVYVYDLQIEKLNQYQINLCQDEVEVCKHSDIIFLGIKPNNIQAVATKIKKVVVDKALVSMVATYPYQKLVTLFDEGTRLLAIMPNTPVKVNAGVILLENQYSLTKEEFDFIEALCHKIGRAITIDSDLMQAATAVSGCGPAMMYIVMEAIADGAVKEGLPRELAYQLVAQTMLGAAKMQLETKIHPAILKDNVCSPKGLTIKAVEALEEGNIRFSFMNAIGKAK